MVRSTKNEFLKSGNGHKRAPLKQTNKKKNGIMYFNAEFNAMSVCLVFLVCRFVHKMPNTISVRSISTSKISQSPSKFNSFSLKLVYDVRLVSYMFPL